MLGTKRIPYSTPNKFPTLTTLVALPATSESRTQGTVAFFQRPKSDTPSIVLCSHEIVKDVIEVRNGADAVGFLVRVPVVLQPK